MLDGALTVRVAVLVLVGAVSAVAACPADTDTIVVSMRAAVATAGSPIRLTAPPP
jgi:hypothetical protein